MNMPMGIEFFFMYRCDVFHLYIFSLYSLFYFYYYLFVHSDQWSCKNTLEPIYTYIDIGCIFCTNYNIGMDTCGFAVADAISDIFISIGTRVSYNVGACNIIPAVPTTTAIVNNHKNKRSNTIATYFQSSFTCPVYSGVFISWWMEFISLTMCHRCDDDWYMEII